jgi:hypothetical protein
VEEFKYLGKPLTNQYSTQKGNKSRLKSGNACYNSVQNLFSSSLLPNNKKITKYIEGGRMRWARHVAFTMREKRSKYRVWWGNLRERDHLEDPDVNGRIILRWIFRKWDVRAWNGSIWFREGTGGRHLRMR